MEAVMFSEDLARFWGYVDIPTHGHWREHCWLWTGALTTDNPRHSQGSPGDGGGYPKFRVDGRVQRGHIWIYRKVKGSFPPGLVVRHTCDNRKCVNLRHLVLGSHSENLQDQYDRGRRSRDDVPF